MQFFIIILGLLMTIGWKYAQNNRSTVDVLMLLLLLLPNA